MNPIRKILLNETREEKIQPADDSVSLHMLAWPKSIMVGGF